ncbi:MAG: porphobilinogen synthase [Rhodoluna sp.]
MSLNPMNHRPRRLRANQAIRNLVSETQVRPEQLILPMFVKEGLDEPRPINGLPGVVQHSMSSLKVEVDRALSSGIGGVMIFGIPDHRDPQGSEALNPNGILATAVRQIRDQVGDRMVVIADLCLDEFTSHGHCGVLGSTDAHGNCSVDNDATIEIYERMSVVLAEAGAHMLGASGMMDGQVAASRKALDAANFKDVAILAYAAKYASAFYGPFRDAVESELEGDRKAYQQDPRNSRESSREIKLDAAEGADIIMVKPALAYLDIVRLAAETVDLPIASYIVSGEMAMIEAAAAQGLIAREPAILEALASVHRAGASIICTYWAIEAAELLTKG